LCVRSIIFSPPPTADLREALSADTAGHEKARLDELSTPHRACDGTLDSQTLTGGQGSGFGGPSVSRFKRGRGGVLHEHSAARK
jgi:hypothetical protein